MWKVSLSEHNWQRIFFPGAQPRQTSQRAIDTPQATGIAAHNHTLHLSYRTRQDSLPLFPLDGCTPLSNPFSIFSLEIEFPSYYKYFSNKCNLSGIFCPTVSVSVSCVLRVFQELRVPWEPPTPCLACADVLSVRSCPTNQIDNRRRGA